MRYLLAILLPPVAIFTHGRPIQALLNLFLSIIGFLPEVMHAALGVSQFQADRRHEQMLKALPK